MKKISEIESRSIIFKNVKKNCDYLFSIFSQKEMKFGLWLLDFKQCLIAIGKLAEKSNTLMLKFGRRFNHEVFRIKI